MSNVKRSGVFAELWMDSATIAKVLGLSDYTIDISMGTVDVTDHDSAGWGEKMTTFAQWTATAKFWYLMDATTGVQETTQAKALTALPAGTVMLVEFRPNGTGSGKAKLSGSCRISKWATAAPTSGAQNMDISLEGIGALTVGTQT
jgi:predicted secreted protein